MLLTFEVMGTELDIHMDAEGRDHLVRLLSSLDKPGDHYHMFRFDDAVGTDITKHRLDADSICMESGVLWLLDSEGTAGDEEELDA